jgi:hypothetical protein
MVSQQITYAIQRECNSWVIYLNFYECGQSWVQYISKRFILKQTHYQYMQKTSPCNIQYLKAFHHSYLGQFKLTSQLNIKYNQSITKHTLEVNIIHYIRMILIPGSTSIPRCSNTRMYVKEYTYTIYIFVVFYLRKHAANCIGNNVYWQ